MNKNKKISITEEKSDLPLIQPVYEKFGVFINSINPNLPNRNGAVYLILGGPGSGKTSMLLSLFRDTNLLKQKFDEIHYIVPESSFSSVKNHPFKDHDKIHHELSSDLLNEIYEDCIDRKDEAIANKQSLEHTCLILDDYGSQLKDPDIVYTLKRIMSRSRHCGLYIIMICQTYKMIPIELRRIITNISVYRPSIEEWSLLCADVILLKKIVCDQIYQYVYDKPFNHFDIDLKLGVLRKNFNLLQIGE